MDVKSRLTLRDDWIVPTSKRKTSPEAPTDAAYQPRTGPDTTDGDDLVLPHLVSAAKRQWSMSLGTFGFCVLLSLWLYSETPEKFRANAVVLVDDQLSELANSVDASQTFVQDEIGFFNEIEVFNSRELALRVVRRLELTTDPDFNDPPPSLRQKARAWLDRFVGSDQEKQRASDDDLENDTADALRDLLRVTQKGRGHSIELTYDSHNADLATRILNTYLHEYEATPLHANDVANQQVLDWLERRQSFLDEAVSEIETQISALRLMTNAEPKEEAVLLRRLSAIEKVRTTSSETYENLLSSRQAVPIVGVKVLDAPVLPKLPLAPSLTTYVAIGALMGLILAVLFAAFRELFDNKVRIAEQLTDVMDVPFLGYLPRIRHHSLQNGAWRSAYLQKRQGLARLFEETIDETLNLIEARHGSSVRGGLVGLTSMLPGDEKHLVAFNLAARGAERGLNVLIVDGDRHLCELSLLVTNRLEDSNYVHDGDMVLRHGNLRDIEGRLIGVLAHDVSNRKQLPSAAKCDDVINYADKIAHMYDIVVIDFPALVVSTDARKNAPSLSTVFFVAAWGHTPKKLVEKHFALNPDFVRRLHGLIINQTNIRRLKTYSLNGYEAFLTT